ncbi:MAG TPA: hypothetical protein VHE33_08575 [Acidobacteriaceae bacterium]|nr:hypothetical protein [Acidobacteriaceae bacterium]
MVPWNSVCVTLGALFLRFAAMQGSATDPNANAISAFFGRLTADLTVFALAMAGFFFALSALFYMASGATQNERTRQHAISALYAALGGLALALLAGTVALLINNAATGASAGGPAN